mmetsp:Transcript_9349/g.24056  ORF Transcript_9349/g.24056 Transcript_9349/m.24056 type:complete len:258 (-) Transcript_9349:302-1075(-)
MLIAGGTQQAILVVAPTDFADVAAQDRVDLSQVDVSLIDVRFKVQNVELELHDPHRLARFVDSSARRLAVVDKLARKDRASLRGVHGVSVLLVICPLADVGGPTGVLKCARAVAFAVHKLADILVVLNEIGGDKPLSEPCVLAVSVLDPVAPFAGVRLVLRLPDHRAVAMPLVVLPLTLVNVARCVNHLAGAVPSIRVKVAYIDRDVIPPMGSRTAVLKRALSVPLPSDPVSLVHPRGAVVDPLAMPQAMVNLPRVR